MELNYLIEQAIKNPIQFQRFDYYTGAEELNATSNVLQLILYDYNHEDYEEKNAVRNAIKQGLYLVLHKNGAPAFDNSHNWGYSLLCESIALIKYKTELWNLFSQDEQVKLTLIMKMFALMWNFGCNAYNGFATGIGLHGNYGKDSGPNYRLTNNMLMPYIASFFGSLHNVNLFFEYEADYDYIIAELKKHGFKNAYYNWTTPARTLSNGINAPGARELYNTRENYIAGGPHVTAYTEDVRGNCLYLGHGIGCRACYHYRPYQSTIEVSHTHYQDLIDDVLLDCFSGGEVISLVYIEDEDDYCQMDYDELSPYEGQEGMMKEFNIPDDSMGQRSSIFHCELDFSLVTASLATLKMLDILEPTSLPYWDKIQVGMNDFLFKKEHNYRGYSMGNFEDYINHSLPTELWKEYWNNNLREA